jgi:membrane-associated phospholipid phosphatase
MNNPVVVTEKRRNRARFMYILPFAVLVYLSVAVGLGHSIPFDAPIMNYVGNLRSSGLTSFFKIITDIGSTGAVIAAVVAIGLALIPKRKHFELILIAVAVGGAGAIALVMKVAFGRMRPDYLSHLVVETGRSFPSGHSVVSSALAVSLIYLLWRTRARYYALVFGLTYVLLVGLSRVYLGVHYPSDVLASWSISWLWVGLTAHWFVSNSRRVKR